MAIKTLHLTYLFNAQSGGVATFYRALMRRATETGRQMVLVIPGESNAAEEWSPSVRIYRVKAGRSLIGDRRYRVPLPHHFLFPRDTRLKRILREERPDLVEACDKYSLFYLLGYYRLGWIDGTKGPATVALSMERMDDNFGAYFSRGGAAMEFCRWYMGSVYFRLPKFHIAISRYVAEELQSAPTAPFLDKVRILPLGVDTAAFQPVEDPSKSRGELEQALGLAGVPSVRTRRILLYAGRLSVEKNIPLLIETLQALASETEAEYHLALIGSGMLREELKKQATGRLRGRLHIVPHVDSREKLASMIAGSDVFVHPNAREPFGIGPLEAMSCGVPVVLPNRGGVLEYANERNCWLAEPSSECFAAAVRRIPVSTEERADRVREARATALAHDWTLVADRYFQQYDEFHREFQAAVEPWPIPFKPFRGPMPWEHRPIAAPGRCEERADG